MQKSEPKLKSLTILEKIEIINVIESGKSVKDVAKELGISKNTLHYIYKNKDKIRTEVLIKPVSKLLKFKN